MTQAYNLSQLANNLNTSGQLDATDGLVNAVPVANGGTGASSASGARTNLGLTIGTNVPSPTGTGASGTWAISISGNAATATSATSATNATNAVNATNATNATNASTVTTITTTQVLSATSGATIGAVGTYAFLVSTTATSTNPGVTKAGSDLRYSDNSAAAYTSTTPPHPTGTWRCMGYDSSFVCCGLNFFRATLWLRIS